MTSENEHGIGSTAELFDYTTDAELYSSKFSRRGLSRASLHRLD
jgi:hypothetical protein